MLGNNESENDVILPWPFLNVVTYKLIDQQKYPQKCQHLTRTMRSDLKSNTLEKSIERPTLGENPPWTYHMFSGLSELSERCYILNDTVIIKVVVGPRCKNED